MNYNLLKLKIKIKSLAEEAKIIKEQEDKLKYRVAFHDSCERETEWAKNAKRDTYPVYGHKVPEKIMSKENRRKLRNASAGLRHHRKGIVRNESRHSLLAYGYLRGLPYKTMEQRCSIPPNWSKVEGFIKRFGLYNPEHFKAWIEGKGSEPLPVDPYLSVPMPW